MPHLVPCNAAHAPSALKQRIDPRRIVNRRTTSALETPAARAIINTSYGESVITLSRQHRPHAWHIYENGLCRFIQPSGSATHPWVSRPALRNRARGEPTAVAAVRGAELPKVSGAYHLSST